MTKYICKNGHEIKTDGTPTCQECKVIATHYNTRTGEVFEWTSLREYRAGCQRLQDEMDAAFDNQYFGGGW